MDANLRPTKEGLIMAEEDSVRYAVVGLGWIVVTSKPANRSKRN